jgi:hypothetical protein
MTSPTRARRPSTLLLLFALPVIGLVALLVLPFVGAPASSCGNGFGCGSVRNAGEQDVTVVAFGADGAEQASYAVTPGSRDVLLGVDNAIEVPAGSCLTLEGGPFWLDRVVVDGLDGATRVPVDHWGARVTLTDGGCAR